MGPGVQIPPPSLAEEENKNMGHLERELQLWAFEALGINIVQPISAFTFQKEDKLWKIKLMKVKLS